MKKILPLIFVIFVSACTTYNPIPEGYSGPVANIEDTFSDDTGSSAHYFILYKMDGKMVSNSFGATRSRYVGMGAIFDPVMIDREVLPEYAEFTIHGFKYFPTDAQAMFGDSMKIEKVVTFTPKAGEKYYIKGKLGKEKSEVWIEDASGKIISSDE